jgi:hypothetical protein
MRNDKNKLPFQSVFVKTPKLDRFENFLESFREFIYLFIEEEVVEAEYNNKVYTTKVTRFKGGANIPDETPEDLNALITSEMKSYLHKAAFNIKQSVEEQLGSSIAGCRFESNIIDGKYRPRLMLHLYINGEEATCIEVRPEIYQEEFNEDLAHRFVDFINAYNKAQKVAMLSDAVTFVAFNEIISLSTLDVNAQFRLKGSHCSYRRFLRKLDEIERNLHKLNANYKKVYEAASASDNIQEIFVGEETYQVILNTPNTNGDYKIEGNIEEVHSGLFQHSSLRFLKAG